MNKQGSEFISNTRKALNEYAKMLKTRYHYSQDEIDETIERIKSHDRSTERMMRCGREAKYFDISLPDEEDALRSIAESTLIADFLKRKYSEFITSVSRET